MTESYGIIAIQIEQSETGLFTATSGALEGVYVAHRDFRKIVEDLPLVVQRWFKVHRNQDVTVFTAPLNKAGEGTAIAAIPVPAEIAAQALAR